MGVEDYSKQNGFRVGNSPRTSLFYTHWHPSWIKYFPHQLGTGQVESQLGLRLAMPRALYRITLGCGLADVAQWEGETYIRCAICVSFTDAVCSTQNYRDVRGEGVVVVKATLMCTPGSVRGKLTTKEQRK